ncbi:MAG TPA: ATP-binding protein [Pseudonocardia sp.]|nr:ATP-binding protein [Pseudonocardia sp.]
MTAQSQLAAGEDPALACAAVRHAPIPTAIYGPSGIALASESFAQRLGIPIGELAGAYLVDLPIEPEDGEDLRTVPGDGPGRVVVPRHGPVVRLRANRMPSAEGYVVLQLEELAGRERELRGEIHRLRDLADNSGTLMFIKDLEGRYLLVNRHYRNHFGLTDEQILGNTDFDIFPLEAASEYRTNDVLTVRSGRTLEVEEVDVAEVDAETGATRGTVNDRTLLSIKFPLFDEHGQAYALGGIATDITDRKRAERAAQEAREEAERANQAKSDLLSRISHELRTPLNAIIGFGQLLRMEELHHGAAVNVEHVVAAGEHLLQLVNEVLELSWLDAGAPGLTLTEVHAAVPLREALELIRPLAQEQDIEISSDLHGALHRYVLADTQRLRQVLLNVLSNAVKYNRAAGAVRITCRELDGWLRYLVTDSGTGIDAAELDQLFAPFIRLARQLPGTEGSGLGLALSRRLIEEMGGRIGVSRTAPGEGSTFYVELPLISHHPAQPVELPVASPEGDTGMSGAAATVLYIEDTPANVALVEKIIERMDGLSLLTASTGEQGLALAALHRPQLVLLDLNLADIGGEEVLRRMRASADTEAIPVIVVSADATSARVAQLERTGVVAYLTKPLDVPAFMRIVRGAVGQS